MKDIVGWEGVIEKEKVQWIVRSVGTDGDVQRIWESFYTGRSQLFFP